MIRGRITEREGNFGKVLRTFVYESDGITEHEGENLGRVKRALVFGTDGKTLPEIFIAYEDIRAKYGARMNEIPTGAIGIYTYAQRFKVGLQQLMAGSRNFTIPSISRKDIMALTEEAAKISGIPYVMNAYRDEAEAILGS